MSLSEVLRSKTPNLNKRQVHALNNITLDIVDGERLGIIGANGAGKTTLLSILAGMSEATGGSLEINGEIHAMLTIGAVLNPELSGRENIRLDHTVHGRTPQEINEVEAEIIDFIELGDFIDRPVRTYSSGMQARLAFAMGAYIHPEILILDETLSVGDIFFAKKASILMKKMADSGRIVLLVTHSTKDIVDMCTRCIWLENGCIKMDGDPDEVTKAYINAVKKSDETALMRKFTQAQMLQTRPEVGHISAVEIEQDGESKKANVLARRAVTFTIAGKLNSSAPDADLRLSIQRVDGRHIWSENLRNTGGRLNPKAEFSVDVKLDPFILGQDLFRLEVVLVDGDGVCDAALRVFEVVDQEGQYGGNPQLFHAPEITCKKIEV